MTFNGIDLSQILVIVNFIVAFLLLLYGFYLGSIEKNIRKKEDQLDKFSAQIIKEANYKALNIIKDSKFISESLKKEIDGNFDALLDSLKADSDNFYKQVEQEYLKSSQKFATEMEQKAEAEIEDFSKRVTFSADEARKDFEKKYLDEYTKAMQELEAYKINKKSEFEKEMIQKIEEVTKMLIPLNVSIEDHQKLVEEAIERAYRDKTL